MRNRARGGRRGFLTSALLQLPWILLLASACRSTGSEGVEPHADDAPAVAGQEEQSSDYDLRFHGNDSYSKAELRSALALTLRDFEKSGLHKAFIDDAAYDLGVHYRERGFHFVEVDYRFETEGKLQVHIDIVEGPRVELGKVRVHGNLRFSDSELRGLFGAREQGLFGPTGPLLYIAGQITGASGSIARLYRGEGYFDVQVHDPVIDFNEARTRAHVTVVIQEGSAYPMRLPTVEMTGGTEKQLQYCESAMAKFHDLAYYPRRIMEMRAILMEYFASSGYPDARVQVNGVPIHEETTVDIHVRVAPGQLVRIGAVQLAGNDSTKDSFLRSRLTFEMGETYDVTKLRESTEKIYRTGLFKRVRIELDETATGPERPVLVTVLEAPSIEAWIEPGFGSYELFRLGFGVREKNLWGTGRQLKAEANAAVRAQKATISLANPWFLRTSLKSDVALSYERREQPTFTSTDRTLGFFLTKEWDHADSTTFGYQFRQSRLADVTVEIDYNELAEILENVDISSLKFTQRHDTRDQIFMPSNGSWLQIDLEYGDHSLGSQLEFQRIEGRAARFIPLTDSISIAGQVRIGIISPFGSDDFIPLQERYFLGGDSSVRSFNESELGPVDAGNDPIGGEARLVANIELRAKVTNSFYTTLFADAGHVALQAGNLFDLKDEDVLDDGKVTVKGSELSFAVGFGIAYMLPLGPLRLDFGFNPDADPDRGEDDWAVHFAIGMAF